MLRCCSELICMYVHALLWSLWQLRRDLRRPPHHDARAGGQGPGLGAGDRPDQRWHRQGGCECATGAT